MQDHARTCYHEAGRAVVFWALTGLTVERVEIYADGTGSVDIGTEAQFFSRMSAEREAMVSAAGCAAELRYEFADCHTWSDKDRYLHIIELLLVQPEARHADYDRVTAAKRQRHIIKKANALIDEHWAAIERLAAALNALTKVPDFQTVSMTAGQMDPIVLGRPRLYLVSNKPKKA